MSTLDTAALWSATSLAFDEKKIGAAGLSVRQRKLLALLNQPTSVSQLAKSIALPDYEVQSALERFAKLGLAQSDAPTPFNPMQVRVTPASASVAEKPSRMPFMIGAAVAALTLVAVVAWLLSGGSGKTSDKPAVAVAAPASPSTPTGPTDSADNKLPRSAAAPAAATPPVSPPVAPAPAATAAPSATAATKAALSPTPTATAAITAVPSKNAITPITPALATAPATAPATTLAAATVAPTPTTTPATAAPTVVAAPTVAAIAPPNAPPTAASVTPPPTPPTAAVAAAPAAAARPAAPAAAREIKLINRVEPSFPRGVDAERGTVRARLQVDARGNVTSVDIVEANPPRVFDRTVRSALQQWRYEPTGEAFTTAAEISFSR